MNKLTLSAKLSGGLLVLSLLVAALGQKLLPHHHATPRQDNKAPATLGLESGTLDFDTSDFTLKLVKASQTIAALQPKGANGFDFTPADRLNLRAANGYHHLGDLTLRVRQGQSEAWRDYDTAAARQPVRALPASGDVLASAELASTLPPDCPVQITRSWSQEHGRLVLRFVIKNTLTRSIQIGALGIPMIFNNIITDRDLAQSHEKCVFFDPYIGQDAGYLQVTRLNGKGPVLVVVPDGHTPFEAYQPLQEPTFASQTFEGAFAWMAHSHAYVENEWHSAVPWNPSTLATLKPGATRTYGVKFLLSPQIRDIEATLTHNVRPVAVSIPGYVLPQDLNACLFLDSGREIRTMDVEPKNAITIQQDGFPNARWQAFTLRGKTWGRARLTITYGDGLTQSIHYYVIKPAAHAVADLGHFLLTSQWFVDPEDPFHRSPSVMSYDRENNKIVAQESRVWIAGLSDEGGCGSWLAAAMKEFGQPDKSELARYEQFINGVLWGGIQYKSGPQAYGVRKSLFFYAPKELPAFQYDKSFDWRSWTSWNRAASEDIGRGYNYPHVVAAYWTMYRLARNHPGLVVGHPWQWYLDHAYQTVEFLTNPAPVGRPRVGYTNTGLMEGDVFVLLLKDLQREGWTKEAALLESRMKARADRWKDEAYPFGSEMAWDSTGQEEVYAWCKYFGHDDKAEVSLDSILGYMPTIPHWGYNGNARRYWDFLYAGKLTRIERQLHHYGSGINAIPVLAEYRQHPNDYYLLRIGYGGTMGALTNIDQEGFASAAFHSFPSTLKWDGYSGDYGPNFFGHALNAATYIIHHPHFGWQAFGGNVEQSGEWLRVRPLDSFRTRLYIAPRGLWLTLDAGTFESIAINTRTHAVRVELSSASPYTPLARLRIEQPAQIKGVETYHLAQRLAMERGAYVVPLRQNTTWVTLGDG